MGKKKMSVADILAAARAEKGGEGSPAPQAEEESAAPEVQAEAPAAEAAESAEEAPAAEAPAKPIPKPGSGGKRSIADILAAARAEKAAGAKPKPAAKPAPKPAAKAPAEKPAAKPAAEKPAAKKPEKTGPRSTASILAAARAQSKPGPISKAEAARRADSGADGSAKEKAKPAAKSKPSAPPMPQKPVAAQKKPAKGETDEERRGFMAAMAVAVGSFVGLGFTALAGTAGLWTLGVARYMFPNILTEPPSQFKVGFPADFPPGMVITKFKAQYGVWVVNAEYNGEPQLYALKTVCTHLGCTPNWLEAEQKFKCPCHGSGFYKDGINFEGPAPRPLERYAIRIADDGQLEIDKSKTFQEEMGQWSDPSCYVIV